MLYIIIGLGVLLILFFGLKDGTVHQWDRAGTSIAVGLYPFGEPHPLDAGNPAQVFEYRSDPILVNNGETPVFFTERLNLKNWRIVWRVEVLSRQTVEWMGRKTTLPKDAPFRMRSTLTYQGDLEELKSPTTDKLKRRLTACRPELLLVPATGVSVRSTHYHPSFLKGVFGVKGPKRLRESGKRPVNAILFMIDTLRPDHTPPYGHPYIIAPHIDMLASLGTVFTNSYGASSQTRPSVGSMFSGLQPLAHGAVRHATQSAMIHLGVPMLAEAFQQAGCSTQGVTSNAQVTNQFGFSKGFDSYRFTNFESNVTPMGLDILKTLDEPYFLYLHYMGPHSPYEPASPWKGMYRGKAKYKEQNAYSEEITLEDRRIGLILKELSMQGLLNRTLIWLVSDHGEEFWEHDWNGHGAKLYEETVRTVSIISHPAGLPMGQRITQPVTHADMFPTLASQFQLDTPKILQGIDLTPWLHGRIDPEQAARPLFLHLGGGLGPGPDESDKEGILLDGKKLIWWPQKNEWELYDLATDPGEKNNLIQQPGEIRQTLEALLRKHIGRSEEIANRYEIPGEEDTLPGLTDTEIEKLKRDGYLGGS